MTQFLRRKLIKAFWWIINKTMGTYICSSRFFAKRSDNEKQIGKNLTLYHAVTANIYHVYWFLLPMVTAESYSSYQPYCVTTIIYVLWIINKVIDKRSERNILRDMFFFFSFLWRTRWCDICIIVINLDIVDPEYLIVFFDGINCHHDEYSSIIKNEVFMIKVPNQAIFIWYQVFLKKIFLDSFKVFLWDNPNRKEMLIRIKSIGIL